MKILKLYVLKFVKTLKMFIDLLHFEENVESY